MSPRGEGSREGGRRNKGNLISFTLKVAGRNVIAHIQMVGKPIGSICLKAIRICVYTLILLDGPKT